MTTFAYPASQRAKMIRQILTQNAGRFATVTFVKKDGSVRTLVGNFGKVKSQTGRNNAAEYEKYVCMVLPEKDANGQPLRRNVNCETVMSIKTNGTLITFQ